MKYVISYLACPYHHDNPLIKAQRLQTVTKTAAELFTQGIYVYSPLTHNSKLTELGVGGTWDTWCDFDLEMLSRCDKLIVLTLPGWEQSRGVCAEIAHAKKLHKPIEFLACPLYEELSSGISS